MNKQSTKIVDGPLSWRDPQAEKIKAEKIRIVKKAVKKSRDIQAGEQVYSGSYDPNVDD